MYRFKAAKMHNLKNRNVKAIILLLLLFTGSAPGAYSQFERYSFSTYTSEKVTVQQGLSQNTIRSLCEDDNGFIWIGTWDGLNRFDGINYKVFKPDKNNPDVSISNQTVTAIVKAPDGDLFIGTEQGLNHYDYKKQKFTSYHLSAKSYGGVGSDTINALKIDSKNNLWVASTNGLFRFDLANKIATPVVETRGFNINSLQSDPFGELWIASNNGLLVYNIQTKKINYYNDKNRPLFRSTVFTALAYSKSGQMWIGSEKGLYCYNFNKKQWSAYFENENGLPSDNILSLAIDFSGNIWIGTQNSGLVIYHYASKRFVQINNSLDETANQLKSRQINTIMFSKNGNAWLGTWRGLYKYSMYETKFPHYSVSEKLHSYEYNLVWHFCEFDKSNILVGTNGGLIRFDHDSREMHFIDHGKMKSTKLRAIMKAPGDKFWIGTFDDGVYITTIRNDKVNIIRHLQKDDKSFNTLIGDCIWKMIIDRKGIVWVGTEKGISLFDQDGNLKLNIGIDKESHFSLPGEYINDLLEDRDGYIWISTMSGLVRIDPSRHYQETFVQTPKNGLKSNKILTCYQDSKGTIWLGTAGGGLQKYNPKTKKFSSIELKKSFEDNVVYNIIEDPLHYLWITGNSGIIRMNPNDNTFTQYTSADGIQSNEFNLGALMIINNKKIACGGMNGFNVFSAEKIFANPVVPQIVFTDILVNDIPLPNYFKDKDTLELSYSDNFFTIKFAALEFSNPEKNQYAYRLSGNKNEWVYTDASNAKAIFSGLSPGTYTFHVKGSNNFGRWNEKGISLTIIIKPPFWQTWWFRISVILLLGAISSYAINRRIKQIKQRNTLEMHMLEAEKAMFELEQKSLRLQMNPHFMFNSLNSIQNLILQNERNKAVDYLARFSQLMRMVLTAARESYIAFEQEVKLINNYLELESLRFAHSFSYTIFIDPEIDVEFTGVPPMVVQPFIENAILHGLLNKTSGEKKLKVYFYQKKSYILCIVEDNGIGRKAATEIKEASGLTRKSQGMEITRERLKILLSPFDVEDPIEIIDLTDESGNALGTRVRILIPETEI